jgi:hypothetical protein
MSSHDARALPVHYPDVYANVDRADVFDWIEET